MVIVGNDTHPMHSSDAWTQPRLRWTRRIIASVVMLALIGTLTIAGGAWLGLQSRLNSRAMQIPVMTSDNGSKVGTAPSTPVDPNDGRPLNILVLGQDTRGGNKENADIGGHDPADVDNHQADTAMIVHISADRDRIEVVSLPRDSIVNQPACATTNGVAPSRDNVMLNSTFAYGWKYAGNLESAVSCEMATVNAMTGLDITQSVVVDFAGLSKMVDAIGGVDICVPAKVDDVNTNLRLDPGMRHLNGVDATQYARVRHGVDGADGSDIMRTVRQQTVIKALMRQALSNGTLSNPSKLYSLGISAIDSLTMSSGLASAPVLTGLAYSLRNMNFDDVQTMTVPVVPWSQDTNRVVWAEGSDSIWENIRNDRPLGSDDTTTDDSTGHTPVPEHDSDANDGQAQTPADNDGFVMDESIGLLRNADTGELRDPTTGGRVDPDTGYVYDPATGGVVGLAYQYVGKTICKVE